MSADHRQLGRELGLFRTDPLVGAGLPLWLPDGAVIRSELERLAAEEAIRGGCQRVYMALRLRDGRQLPDIPVTDVLTQIAAQVASRSAGLGFGGGKEE